MKPLLTILAICICCVAMGQNNKGLPPGWICSVPNCTYDHSKMYSIPIVSDSVLGNRRFDRKVRVRMQEVPDPDDTVMIRGSGKAGYSSVGTIDSTVTIQFPQVQPDTIKVRLLYDEGNAVPIQRNAWHVYEGTKPESVFLEMNKRKIIHNVFIWQVGGKYIFRPYEWR